MIGGVLPSPPNEIWPFYTFQYPSAVSEVYPEDCTAQVTEHGSIGMGETWEDYIKWMTFSIHSRILVLSYIKYLLFQKSVQGGHFLLYRSL